MRTEIFAGILNNLLNIQLYNGNTEPDGPVGGKGSAYFAQVQAQLEAFSGVIAALLVILNIHRHDWTVRVFLIPESPEIGEYKGEGIVYWGHKEVFPGYHAVGIIHESLHCLLENVHNASDESGKWRLHALIVLIADVYMRSMIDPSGGFKMPRRMDGYNQKLIVEVGEWISTFCRAAVLGNTDLDSLLEMFDLPGRGPIGTTPETPIGRPILISIC